MCIQMSVLRARKDPRRKASARIEPTKNRSRRRTVRSTRAGSMGRGSATIGGGGSTTGVAASRVLSAPAGACKGSADLAGADPREEDSGIEAVGSVDTRGHPERSGVTAALRKEKIG